MGLIRPLRDPLTAFKRRFSEQLARGWCVHVASTGSRIVGFIVIHENEVKQLFVASMLQGNGVGKRLLDFMKSLRPEGFWLVTPAANHRARQFYEREGLKPGKIRLGRRVGYRVIRYEWQPDDGKGRSAS